MTLVNSTVGTVVPTSQFPTGSVQILSSVIRNCSENAIRSTKYLTVLNSVFENTSKDCFYLMSKCDAIFENVTFNNFREDSLVYNSESQISFKNVTINGVRYMDLSKRFHLVINNPTSENDRLSDGLEMSNLVVSKEAQQAFEDNLEVSELASHISHEGQTSGAVVIPVVIMFVVIVIGIGAFLVIKRY